MNIQLILYHDEKELAMALIIKFWQAHNHVTPTSESAESDLKEWTKEGHKFYFIMFNEYSGAIVQAFRKFRAPFSGKAVHTFPERSANVSLVFRWNLYTILCKTCL